jgi:hypothetical protein
VELVKVAFINTVDQQLVQCCVQVVKRAIWLTSAKQYHNLLTTPFLSPFHCSVDLAFRGASISFSYTLTKLHGIDEDTEEGVTKTLEFPPMCAVTVWNLWSLILQVLQGR